MFVGAINNFQYNQITIWYFISKACDLLGEETYNLSYFFNFDPIKVHNRTFVKIDFITYHQNWPMGLSESQNTNRIVSSS